MIPFNPNGTTKLPPKGASTPRPDLAGGLIFGVVATLSTFIAYAVVALSNGFFGSCAALDARSNAVGIGGGIIAVGALCAGRAVRTRLSWSAAPFWMGATSLFVAAAVFVGRFAATPGLCPG